MDSKAFQDHYDEAVSHCYGCGRSNASGLHVKSYWDGEDSVCRFDPRPYHTGIPGYVYGGLIASVIDCHGTATASAAVCRAEGHEVGAAPMPRFVTGGLHVDYLLPTPIDHPMEFRARVTEIKGRKAVVSISVISDGKERARGELVAVRMPTDWLTDEAPLTRRSQLPDRPASAAGVVALRGDAVLLVRRGNEPSRGQWSFPGGSIHPGEMARAAAHREAREETGLDLRILDVVGVYDGIYPGTDDLPGFHYCVANFLAIPTDEAEPQARSDATDACWVPLGSLDAYGITGVVRTTVARAVDRHRQLVPAGARACPRVRGLYVITDETLAPGRSHLDITRAAVAGGARVIQLRDKRLDTGELIHITRQLLAVTRPAGAALIVNDRADVAQAAGADGVHLGTSDMAVADARRLLGPLPLVGYSPETAQQARAAARDGADYLGVGNLYGTETKSDAGEPVGLDHLTALGAASGLPVIGIGGITRDRIPDVLAAGAVGVAVVSAVVRAPDMEATVRELCRAFPADVTR